ncbi:hypothetical protein ACFY04_12620 [Streptomyces sp. NPDC001549]|uniref:hypothetical protein n=1 Tax=Streptomyces sp. NPDC001549 TaxID=3364586 RepID=UPI0036941D36
MNSSAQVYGREFRVRDLGPVLAALLLSLPLATVGTGLYVSGTSAVRTAAYAAEITRLNAAEEV